MPWEHRSEPLAPKHVFAGRMARQILLVTAIVTIALGIGTLGYLWVSKGTENLGFIDSFLEASMLLSGAGPLYTERTSSDSLKLFSSVYALFGTLVVVSSVGILASPVVHRVLHRLHLERGRNG
jgi:hypothetical protein